MRIVPLTVATALAAIIGSVPASFAQPYDQNNRGDDNQSQYQSDMTGPGYQAQNEDSWHRGRAEDRDQDRDRDWGQRSHHRWGPGMGFMGPMSRSARGPMTQGARFHFVRGNARIDIQCPPQNDMQSCVQAAGQLLDKLSSMQKSDGGSSGTPETPPSNPSPSGNR